MPAPLTVLFVGGLPGCGKSTLARELARLTGFALLDKDTLTLPLVEALLSALGSAADDRESTTYAKVRPAEYECLMNTVIENVKLGISSIVVAPFVQEMADPQWGARACEVIGAPTHWLWVQAPLEVMRRRLIQRGSARDRHKLDNWTRYASQVETILPAGTWRVVDSSEERADLLAARLLDCLHL